MALAERKTITERLAVVENELTSHIKKCTYWQRAVFAAALAAAVQSFLHFFIGHI